MHLKKLFIVAILLTTSVVVAFTASATVVNGDFESGDFSGWTTFTTSGGSLGPGGANAVTSFDVTGTGASKAARFQVGVNGGSSEQGGGIFQNIVVAAGTFSIAADIAAWDSTPGNGSNSDWGLFELLIDGAVVDSHDFASPDCCPVQRSTLAHSLALTVGSHEIRLQVLRSSGNGTEVGVTPFQYIDNVAIAAVPLPGAWILFVSAIAALRFRSART